MKKFGLVIFCVTVAGIVAFASLGGRTLDDHEAYVSVTAREMIENNEYIIPTFNGENRLNKTPLPYWLVVAASKFTGQVDEFTARVPTAIMSVLSVLCLLYFVSVLLDFRTAVMAALAWTCSLGYIRYSHCARPEMALTLFTLICFLSFYSAIEEENRKRQVVYSLVFWVSLGLSVMAKAPSSIFFLAISAILYMTTFKRWRQFSKILPVWGLIIFLLICLPWPIAAANAMDWDLSIWQSESVDRFTADSSRSDLELFYYIWKLPQFMLPLVFIVPFAILSPFFKVWGDKRRLMWYLWISLFSGIVFLTLCAGKRQHYILPLMPLAAILVGIVMEDMIFSRKAYSEKESSNIIKWHVIASFIIGLTILIFSFEPAYNSLAKLTGSSIFHGSNLPPYNRLLLNYGLIVGSVLIFSTGLGIFLSIKKKQMSACIAMFSGVTAVIVVAFSLVSAMPAGYEGSLAGFAHELKDTIPNEDNVFVYGGANGVLTHYFGRPIRSVCEAEIEGLYNDNNWLVVSNEKVDLMRKKCSFRETKISSMLDRDGQLREFVVLHRNDSDVTSPIASKKQI